MSEQCSQGFFCPISFILPLEIYCPYIQWLHHQGIVSIQAFTKICHMSDHNMFMSDQTFINQLCERSYISLWVIKSILMIAHTLVLSTHRGFFLSNFCHPAPGDLLSLYPVITPPRDIQAFTKICHMSDHNMFMSDQKHSYDRSHSCSVLPCPKFSKDILHT